MKILAIYPYVPFPLDRGAHHRAFHLLKALAREHEVDLLALAENGRGAEHAPAFEEFCRHVQMAPFQHPSWQKLLPDRLRNPVPSTIEHWNIPILTESIERALAAADYDCVHLLDIVMARPFLDRFRKIPVMADRTRVDLLYQLMEQRRMRFSFKSQILNIENMAKLWRFERAVARRVQAEIVCGIDDANFVARFISQKTPVHVIPNGVDLEFFQSSPRFGQKEARPTVLFCGAMDYNPNIDALRWYFAEMHSAIADAIPHLQLWIVGKDPTPEIQSYARLANVTVTGGVPDVRPYYQKAWLQITPIRVGGGTRLKIVESLAMGTPVVSTTMGAQGLDLLHNHDILLADAKDQFIRQTLRALQDASLRERLACEGQRTVSARLSWNALGVQLQNIYATTFAAKMGHEAPTPVSDFVQAR